MTRLTIHLDHTRSRFCPTHRVSVRRSLNTFMLMMKILWKGKEIFPYETFYWAQSQAFFRGAIGDGLGRTVTARNGHCAICELIYEDEQGQESDNSGVLLQE